MHQDKDRGSKWLLGTHGDALLRLAGLTGFTKWRYAPTEQVAPRRSLDGLFELTYPNEPVTRLVLVEIESYADSTADRQVMDDIMLVALEWRRMPEVVSLVLKPKGEVTVNGRDDRSSASGQVRLTGAWPVVRLWEIDAEGLFADGDIGLIPLAMLARTDRPPAEIVARCVDRINAVPDATERSSLLAVTRIFMGLAGSPFDLVQLPGGKAMFLEKILREVILTPGFADVRESLKEDLMAEVREEARAQVREEVRTESGRAAVIAVLEARFATVPEETAAVVNAITDESRLQHLTRFAAVCSDLAAFSTELASPAP